MTRFALYVGSKNFPNDMKAGDPKTILKYVRMDPSTYAHHPDIEKLFLRTDVSEKDKAEYQRLLEMHDDSKRTPSPSSPGSSRSTE